MHSPGFISQHCRKKEEGEEGEKEGGEGRGREIKAQGQPGLNTNPKVPSKLEIHSEILFEKEPVGEGEGGKTSARLDIQS